MGSPKEQRFDFGALQGVEAGVESPDRVTKSPRKNRTTLEPKRSSALSAEVTEDQLSMSGDRADAITTALKERITRLREHAHLADANEHHSSDDLLSGYSSGSDAAPDEEIETSSESLSIAEFYARVKSAIATQFADEVWVTGEIRSMRVSNGHHFFELADHGADGRAAQQLEVCCWSHQWRAVHASLRGANVELEVGRVIRVLGRVSVWEAAGKLRFNLSQLDVEALLGGIAAARRRLLAMLAAEGLLALNKQRIVPLVPLRVGLITSQGSEAQKDFLGQLARSGFLFDVQLVHSLVQGAEAPGQIAQALSRLGSSALDLCVIIRGGGSRNDLAAFDTEIVARAMAMAPFPIWVGVGHTGDHSVADEVANMAFATPTACGEAVATRVALYWEAIAERAERIGSLSRSRLVTAEDQLSRIERQLGRSAKQQIVRQESRCIDRRARVQSAAAHLVRAQVSAQTQRCLSARRAVEALGQRYERQIGQRAGLLRAFDPARQLSRGWAIVRSVDGRTIRTLDQLTVGAKMINRFVDGEAGVVVEHLHPKIPLANGGTDGSGRVAENEMEQ